ncbi:unnamed protein product [Rotaria sp. Silwood2]|nr:unnamed protein product [Rotaria sp. Silwood2]CAF4150326.1 unnamed protein product [Rotaria sp. Silwood2]
MTAATPSDRAKCFVCGKEKIVYACEGCSKRFCLKDLTEHRQNLGKQFEEIENDRDQFYQKLAHQKNNVTKPLLIQYVDKWEEDSIKKIKQTAEECRQTLIGHQNKHFAEIEKKLSQLTEQLKHTRQENEFNEIDLDRLTTKLSKLTEELGQLPNIKIQQDSASYVNKISVDVSSEIRQGNKLSKLSRPTGSSKLTVRSRFHSDDDDDKPNLSSKTLTRSKNIW